MHNNIEELHIAVPSAFGQGESNLEVAKDSF